MGQIGQRTANKEPTRSAVRERPILFSGPMVRAILDGTKTQSRRVVKPQPVSDVYHRADAPGIWYIDGNACHAYPNARQSWKCPYGAPGDRLYVRESGWVFGRWVRNGKTSRGRTRWRFRAIGQRVRYERPLDHELTYQGSEYDGYVFRPSIHMPRWASRLSLQVTDVRVERLQEISPADAMAEGSGPIITDPNHPLREAAYARGDSVEDEAEGSGYAVYAGAVEGFAALWDSLNAKRAPWDSNPFVWCLTFRRIEA